MLIYLTACLSAYLSITWYITCMIYNEESQVKHSSYQQVLPGGFFKVEEFANF